MWIQLNAKRCLLLFFCAALSSGCVGVNDNNYSRVIKCTDGSPSHQGCLSLSSNGCVLEVNLGLWGGASPQYIKDVRKRPTYRPITVYIVTNAISTHAHFGSHGFPEKYFVDIKSEVAKGIIDVIEAEKPWKWIGSAQIYYEADMIEFKGEYNGHKWSYLSLYPDNSIARISNKLQHHVRKVNTTRQP